MLRAMALRCCIGPFLCRSASCCRAHCTPTRSACSRGLSGRHSPSAGHLDMVTSTSARPGKAAHPLFAPPDTVFASPLTPPGAPICGTIKLNLRRVLQVCSMGALRRRRQPSGGADCSGRDRQGCTARILQRHLQPVREPTAAVAPGLRLALADAGGGNCSGTRVATTNHDCGSLHRG